MCVSFSFFLGLPYIGYYWGFSVYGTADLFWMDTNKWYREHFGYVLYFASFINNVVVQIRSEMIAGGARLGTL